MATNAKAAASKPAAKKKAPAKKRAPASKKAAARKRPAQAKSSASRKAAKEPSLRETEPLPRLSGRFKTQAIGIHLLPFSKRALGLRHLQSCEGFPIVRFGGRLHHAQPQ